MARSKRLPPGTRIWCGDVGSQLLKSCCVFLVIDTSHGSFRVDGPYDIADSAPTCRILGICLLEFGIAILDIAQRRFVGNGSHYHESYEGAGLQDPFLRVPVMTSIKRIITANSGSIGSCSI